MNTQLSFDFQAGSPFHEPLFKFLIKFPKETVELFLTDAYLNDHHFTRVFLSEIKDKEHGEKFREILAKQTQKISDLLQSPAAAVVSRTSYDELYIVLILIQNIEIVLILTRVINTPDQYISGKSKRSCYCSMRAQTVFGRC